MVKKKEKLGTEIKVETTKAVECNTPTKEDLNAVILYKESKNADAVKVPLDATKFSFNNSTYKVVRDSVFTELVTRMKKLPPFFKRDMYLWSFYRAGLPAPLGWDQTKEDDFTAEDILVLDEDDVAIEGINQSIKEEKRHRQVKNLKWILIIIVILIMVAGFIFLLPLITGGLPFKLW